MSRPTTEQFIAQASREALPVPDFVSWDGFPFEGALAIKALSDVVLPEPPRQGAGGLDCDACAAPDSDYVWTDADWRLRATAQPTGLPVVLLLEPRAHHDLADLPDHLIAAMGPMICRIEKALLSLGGIARVHVMRVGDGAEHLHWWFMTRPEGFVQGRGSFLVLWDDVLPPRPVEEWKATLADVAAALNA